jgi:SOS response associated peptidase (SRAP)
MPVILDPDIYDLWLDPGLKDADAASELLKSYDVRMMRCYSVSKRINHVANDDEESSRPVEFADTQNRFLTDAGTSTLDDLARAKYRTQVLGQTLLPFPHPLERRRLECSCPEGSQGPRTPSCNENLWNRFLAVEGIC